MGDPARDIRKRFPDETVSKPKEIKWWNEELLETFGDDFTDPDKLIEHYKIMNK